MSIGLYIVLAAIVVLFLVSIAILFQIFRELRAMRKERVPKA